MSKLLIGLALLAVITLVVGFAAVVQPSIGFGGNDSGSGNGNGGDVVVNGPFQEVYVKALSTGRYDKEEVRVKSGTPVKFFFSAEPRSGCGQLLVIPDFGVQLVSRKGETVSAVFTPTKPGTYAYRCGMNMFRGRLIVE